MMETKNRYKDCTFKTLIQDTYAKSPPTIFTGLS